MLSATAAAVGGDHFDRTSSTPTGANGDEGAGPITVSLGHPYVTATQVLPPTSAGGPGALTPDSASDSSANSAASASISVAAAAKKKVKALTLPQYPGPHRVAVSHVETRRDPADPTSHGLLASIFYPCETITQRKNTPRRARWLAGPNAKFYATGYGDFVRIPKLISGSVVAHFLGSMQMPAFLSAPNAPLPVSTSPYLPRRLPTLIFSHGLAGNQTTYSSIVGTVASRGFVCISIEHRDGSASISAFDNYKTPINYETPSPQSMREGEDKDAYLKRWRSEQVKRRCEEVSEAVRLLRFLDDPKEAPLPFVFGESALPTNISGRIDFASLILCGHSFGGATVMTTLKDPSNPFCAGIAFDPWMFAVPSSGAITRPILTVQAEFFHWSENLELVLQAYRSTPSSQLRKDGDAEQISGAPSSFAVVLGTRHQELSDISFVAPSLMTMLKITGGTNTNVVQTIYDALMCKFIRSIFSYQSGGLRDETVASRAILLASLPAVEDIPRTVALEGEEAIEHLRSSVPKTWEETKR
ncbi:platelet-activating factor acetylhydrolase, isoform II-domain-containing protein [Zopfochytrium polystomum]|nr:platelet-activating factor acetylhydrolase, isoform II-domain-containing protein [Zopfochytrium polystomum]